MIKKKIVCLGAGSLYFKYALIDLAVCRDLEGSEIVRSIKNLGCGHSPLWIGEIK